MKRLPPLANLIVDKAIDNTNRKLVAGLRNKRNSRPGARSTDLGVVASDALDAVSADSVMAVANRGQAWREMIEKSLTHGISSLKTMRFDGEFSIRDGKPTGLENVPNKPGVYVVYDKQGQAVYVGDSGRLQKRWHAGHLNEHRQGERANDPYKLAPEFVEGCTVRYVVMDSEATAAAVEAHLIKTENPRVNSREELKSEQGTRDNIEAKKMKDASGSTASLAAQAGVEALKNSGWAVMEQLTAAVLKALKDELVDILAGGKAKILARVERICMQVWEVIKRIIEAPLQLLKGVFEFIVNALSKTIGQIYQMARNIFDLGNAAWDLYKGAQSMGREELIRKISETVIVSGTLVVWDAIDPIVESQLLPLVGPAAPYLAAGISAVGFGLSSHYLQQVVPKIIAYLMDSRSSHGAALDAQRDACLQLMRVKEQEFDMVNALGQYAASTLALEVETRTHIAVLAEHTPVRRLDIRQLAKNMK